MINNLLFKNILHIGLATLGLQACTPDYSKHIEVLNNIDANSSYYLYDRLDDMDNNNPIKFGKLGSKFVQCMKSYKNDWNPGGTENRLYLEIQGNTGEMTYYYTIRANGDVIETVSRWKEKLKHGFKGGKPRLKINCTLSDLGNNI